MQEEGEPYWLTRARREIGQQEDDGPGSNPRIVEYHSHTKLKATDDTIPWCSSFMCWVFESEGIPSTKSAAAVSWLDWGEALEKPVIGCVVVLRRLSGGPAAAHVGLYVGELPGSIEILGGNQQNRVCVQPFPLSLVLGYRKPDSRYCWSQSNVKRELDS
jgi:uncharacterized protein (TIGR02594 family)